MSQRWLSHFKTQESWGVLSIPKIHLKQLKWGEEGSSPGLCINTLGCQILFGVGTWKRKATLYVSAHPFLHGSHFLPSVIKTWLKNKRERDRKPNITCSLMKKIPLPAWKWLQSPCPSASLSPPPLSHSPPLERNPWHARTFSLIYTCLMLLLTLHMVQRCHWDKRMPWIHGRPSLWLLARLAIHSL